MHKAKWVVLSLGTAHSASHPKVALKDVIWLLLILLATL